MDSVAIQTQALREMQAVATADQQRLDEESLQRLKAEDAKAKVQLQPAQWQLALSHIASSANPCFALSLSPDVCAPCAGEWRPE